MYCVLTKVWFRLLGVCAVATILCLSAGSASAGELESAFFQLLSDPDNPELNFRYAALAEERGEPRKALQAYERVIASDPSNEEARRGYTRLRRKLQPAVTSVRTEIGTTYMSNPRQLPSNEKHEDTAIFDARVYVFDDRPIGDLRWRTLASGNADLFSETNNLNNAGISAYTGPIFDLAENLRLHIAPGGSVTWLDDTWLYGEGAVRLSLSTIIGGASQSLTLTGSYRDVNSELSDSSGYSVSLVGRFAATSVLAEGDGVYLIPRVRYSEPTGDGPGQIFSQPLFPGNFYEAGGRLVYFLPTFGSNVHLGVGFAAYYRDYEQNVALASNDRHDTFIEPTAHLILDDPFDAGFDVRFDYRYEENFSNDDTEDFQNHVAGTRLIRRF